MAAVLTAAIFMASFGPGTAALAADLQGPEVSAAEGGISRIQPLTMGPSLLAPAAAPLSAPAAVPELGGHARPQAAAAAASMMPAAAAQLAPASAAVPALAAPADGPMDRLGQWFSGLVGRPAAAPSSGSAGESAAAPGGARDDAGAAKARAGVPFGEDAGVPRADSDDAIEPPAGAAAMPALVSPRRLAGLVAAESRVRASAKKSVRAAAKSRVAHLRLVRVSVDLGAGAPSWTFTYHEPVRKELLTYGPEGVERRKLRAGEKPAMIRQEELAAADLDRALAAVAAENPGFEAVRAELVPRADGGFTELFFDARGLSVAAPARAAAASDSAAAPAAAASSSGERTGVSEPPQAPVPPAVAPESSPASPEAKKPGSHVYEGAFGVRSSGSPVLSFVDRFMGALGFRTVRGVVHDPALGRLPADADVPRILAQFAEFGLSREKVLELGLSFRLDEKSPRRKWLELYDALKTQNVAAGKRYDSTKYEGEKPANPQHGLRAVLWRIGERFQAYTRFEAGSYRELANRTYEPGFRGALRRAAEPWKWFLGLAVRAPYHLFDMFFFGYFRQAITFEFFHQGEDFLALSTEKNLAEKYLAAAMQKQYFGGTGLLAGLREQAWFRGVERWVVTPVAKPLVTFVVRRLTLAILSAVALGLLGAFAPALPLTFALTALPLGIGSSLVWALNILPWMTGLLPFVGHFLAPVVTAAVGSLTKQLVLGPLIQTLILSTLLTFPRVASERLARARDMHPMLKLTAGERFRAIAGAAVSWQFLSANLKSSFGLMTVGAEISGILTYAGQMDAAVNPAFSAVTGRQFTAFHAIGASVDGQNGTITWGNVLLNKLQDLTGVHLSDYVMHGAQDVKHFVGAGAATDAANETAAAAVQGAETRAGGKTLFDPDLWKKSPGEAAARIKDLVGSAGGFDAELAAVKARMNTVKANMGDAQARLADLSKQSKPVPQADREKLAALTKELAAKSDESYVQKKLSEAANLKTPKPDDADDLKKLRALQEKYKAGLPPPPPDRNGYWEQLAAQEATYKALSSRLTQYAKGSTPDGAKSDGAAPPLDKKTRESIEKLVGEIQVQRGQIQAEMTERDATASLIKAANTIRNHALDERRNGQDMLAFHTDFAKLSTVVDLALSLNEIAAAQKAIGQMTNLLEAKQAAVNTAQQQNQTNAAAAAANAAQIATWQQEANATVAGDQSSQANMVTLGGQAGLAGSRAATFQQQIGGLITAINAMDKGSSPTAAAQYQADLNLLAQVAQWRTTGNPNNPTAFSLTGLQADQAQIASYLSQAQTGLSQIQTMPVEFAGALVIAMPPVPGQANVTNPTQAQTLQIIAARQAYYQSQLATYQADLNTVNQDLNPNFTIVDEFGLGHNYNQSVANMATLHPSAPASGSKLDAQADLAQLDTIATELNSVAGAHIPLLSGLTLTQLQTAMPNYGTALEAVSFPTTTGTVPPAVYQAKMDLILAAQLTPMAARAIINWSVDQATVDAFNSAEAPGGALTVAKQGLTGIVNMLNAVLSDATADIAFVNAGAPPSGDQALINRKLALLNNPSSGMIPMLTQAQGMMSTLIAYQQGTITQVAGNTSQYYTLFSSDQTLLTQTQNLFNTTMPWSLASFGGTPGNVAASLASIANWKQSLNQYITGYTDSNGVYQEGITQYQQDMKDRQCTSGCTRTEVLYGETQPYSLPQKISQYGAEATTRATEINTQDATINQILTKIQTLSGGKYNLSAYTLPTGIGTDAGSQAKITALVNANTIQNLGTQLQTIGTAAQAAGGGGVTIGVGTSGTVPTGTQPSPTISTNQQIALLALAAAELLVPSANSQASATNAPEAFAVARYSYSTAVVSAAQTDLTTEVQPAVAFLQVAATDLGAAIAQTTQDVAYVNSNGASETPSALYARKIALFANLNGFLQQGAAFYAMKTGWDQGATATINQIQTYYNALNSIYTSGTTVNTSETTAISTMLTSLQTESASLAKTQAQVQAWMSQLDPSQQSALANVSDDVSKIQVKTRAVLDANINWHELDDQMKRSQSLITSDLTTVNDKQQELAAILQDPRVQKAMASEPDLADLAKKINDLRVSGGTFMMGGAGGQPQALVIKKTEFSHFLDTMLGMLQNGTQALSTQDTTALKADLLSNPAGLAAFMPGSGIMNFGDDADGFYLVYQSQLSVPNGLATSSWVTLGNVAKLWGNNVSINGYEFLSPPSSNNSNAPYGDKGVEVQVESLQNTDSVNYLNVDLHRFGLDIPASDGVAATAAENRLMVFDDYAMMLLGDKLYVGLTGYGDMGLNQPGDNPYYMGGNITTSLKLNEVMSLNASQANLFVNDPRQFLENINLNFTGYDPSLNQNFAVMAQGDSKYYSRTQVGPQFDINRMMNPQGGGNTFTVSLYGADTAGSDDITQKSLGATIVKGFSIKNDKGKTWLQIDNTATGELGQVDNTLSDTLSFTLPDKGITLSGQGQMIGGQQAEYAQISKKTGANTSIALGYGSQYIGEGNRASLTMNTSFTLAQLWQSVASNSAKNLKGAETLQQFNTDIGKLFDPKAKSSLTVAELSKVYEADISRKLITQDVGTLTRDIQDLRKAGAILDNTRVRGMIGFTSNAASNDQDELALGGGPTAGTYTEMTLSKTQKALIQDKSASLYQDGLHLQDRLLDLTRDWQAAVVDVAQAQWKVKLAAFEADPDPKHSTSGPVRAEAEVRKAAALDELHQALLRYNAMTGRNPDTASPFQDLNAKDLSDLMDGIKTLVTAPDRYTKILGALDQGGKQMLDQYSRNQSDKQDEAALRKELSGQIGKDSFNLVDWLPFVDRLTAGMGVQYQDMMNSQALTLGGSVRLPIYDPSSKELNKSYVLESKATLEEMASTYRQRAERAAGERAQALAAQASADEIAPQGPAADKLAMDAIRQYRNGLIDADALRDAFKNWRWYAASTLQAQSDASLAAAQAAMDESMGLKLRTPAPSAPLRISSLQDAFGQAAANSHDLEEVADRASAADAMRRAEAHRIQKFWVDIEVGTGLTTSGMGYIPDLSITGIPVEPVFGFELKPEELRELQVKQHTNQEAYYDALKTRLEAGMAVQFYQDFVAYDSAQKQLGLYSGDVLPQLEAEARTGGPDARKILDEAYVARDQTALQSATALARMNLLLGRQADAPLSFDMTPAQALDALNKLLKEKKPVETQKEILESRVKVAHAVEEMVDKNLKVDTLQLEPVSMIVRSLGRLMGSLGSGPAYNADAAAAARLTTATEERAQENYDAQREGQAAHLRLEIKTKELERAALKGDPQKPLKEIGIDAAIESLKANLLAVGEPLEAKTSGTMPASWAALERRLSDAEKAQAPGADESATLAVPDAEVLTHPLPSGAYVRYDYARQTIGHAILDKGYVDGWIEVRLKNPNTPPEVLLQLSQLRADRADQEARAQSAGAAGQAEVLAAEFKSDVRLLDWARNQMEHPGNGGPTNLASFSRDLNLKLDGERRQIAALLDLPLDDKAGGLFALDALALVGTPATPALPDMGDKLIADIRAGQIETIRRTLFQDGLPAGLGGKEDLLSQIDAKTVDRMMTYKGFTPVAAAGMFRGTLVSSGFLEGPDPRLIERSLENVISDALRKQLESDGQMKELSLHLYQLLSQVHDGAAELEAQRHQIETAESDLKARTALAFVGPTPELAAAQAPEVIAAQKRLLEAWSQFDQTMADTKSGFIGLVTELEALGQTSGGELRPFEDAPAPQAAPVVRLDARSQLVDYWTQRMADPAFASAQDALLARAGAAAPAEARARILAAADLYRQALKDDAAVRDNDFTGLEKLDLLTRNDVEGKRLILRDQINHELTSFEALDAHISPAGEIIAFVRTDVDKSAAAGTADRDQKRAVAGELRRTFIGAMKPSVAAGAAFDRLEGLEKTLDDKRQALLDVYLSKAGDDPKKFILTDLELDEYLKAQSALDSELAETLKSPEFAPETGMARVLDGLYDVNASLARSADQLQSGRGMAALDALIMLEETRLRAARWSGRPPTEIDRVAEALQSLRDMKAGWAAKTKDAGLEPVYALTVVSPTGERTWNAKKWVTLADVKLHYWDEKTNAPMKVVDLVEDVVDPVTGKETHPTVRYALVGGVDTAQAELDAASHGLADNETYNKIAALENVPGNDFVAIGGETADGQRSPSVGLSFDKVFVGKDSDYANGRLFFFKSDAGGKWLDPLTALSLPPEQVAMERYTGSEALRHDLFPTLKSLQDSEEAKDFSRLAVSPNGAEAIVSHAHSYADAQLGRGWIEVKLNSFGFARDKSGRMTQLYRTKDDFSAQWKAFDKAEVDLAAAKLKLGVAPDAKKGIVGSGAAAEEASVKNDDAAKQAAYDAARKAYQGVYDAGLKSFRGGFLNTPAAQKALERQNAAAKAVDKAGPSDAPAKTEFDAAVNAYKALLDKTPEKKALDAATKAKKEADKRYAEAKTKFLNAKKAVDEVKETLAESKSWTLYSASALDVSLDAQGRVVHVAAPDSDSSRAPTGGTRAALDQDFAGGGRTAAKHLSGNLSAVVLDADGRVVKSYETSSAVDDAAKNWTLMSVTPDGDVNARLPDGSVRTKVRLSHYEEKDEVGGTVQSLPVLLSEHYLIEQLDASKSKLTSAGRWAIMPYNWGNIVLEIPRELVQAPAEVFEGRDLSSSHYLGRAQMYKTEGGEEQHGFFRTALGWVDVLNLLPDPVQRYFDPSQFPDSVHVNSALKPGEILDGKSMHDDHVDWALYAEFIQQRAADGTADGALLAQKYKDAVEKTVGPGGVLPGPNNAFSLTMDVKSIESESMFRDMIASDPFFAQLRSDPRFIAFEKSHHAASSDVKFGAVEMTRRVREANEDLDAARERTLARFNGGVEQVTMELRRGRAGDYEESQLSVQSGEIKSGLGSESAVDKTLRDDAALAGDPAANGTGEYAVTTTPGALFVDKLSRRVKVYPGAAGYERQVRAMDGYKERVQQEDAAQNDPQLQARLKDAKATADTLVKGQISARDAAAINEQDSWNKYHVLADRIGLQDELVRQMSALQSEMKDLQAELDSWTKYGSDLEAAHQGGGSVIPGKSGQPGKPGQPEKPGHARFPWAHNLKFWTWMLALPGIGALLAALQRGLTRRSRPL